MATTQKENTDYERQMWEVRLPNGYRAGLRIEQSGLEAWPVLGPDTLLSQSSSSLIGSPHIGV